MGALRLQEQVPPKPATGTGVPGVTPSWAGQHPTPPSGEPTNSTPAHSRGCPRSTGAAGWSRKYKAPPCGSPVPWTWVGIGQWVGRNGSHHRRAASCYGHTHTTCRFSQPPAPPWWVFLGSPRTRLGLWGTMGPARQRCPASGSASRPPASGVPSHCPGWLCGLLRAARLRLRPWSPSLIL